MPNEKYCPTSATHEPIRCSRVACGQWSERYNECSHVVQADALATIAIAVKEAASKMGNGGLLGLLTKG